MPSPVRHFALLIGVNEYPSWDGGAHDLLAPRNDTKSWFHILRRAGVPTANIQLLTSTPLTPEELGVDTAQVGRATKLEVYRGFARLIGQGATAVGVEAGGVQPGPATNQDVVVFVAFSGHGDFNGGQGSYLALSDYDGSALGTRARGIIDIADFERYIQTLVPGATCVFVVDACRHSAHRKGAPAPALDRSIVIAATREGYSSYERYFHSEWRSELSWAVQTVLEQWPSAEHEGQRYTAVSYHTLVKRTGQLLRAFEDQNGPQRPELLAPKAGSDAPFLFPASSELTTSRFARPGRAHEFGTGTTEFRPDKTSAPWAILNTVSSGNPPTVTQMMFVKSDHVNAQNVIVWPDNFTVHHTEIQNADTVLGQGTYKTFGVSATWGVTKSTTLPFTPNRISAGLWIAANVAGNTVNWAHAIPASSETETSMLVDTDPPNTTPWKDHSWADISPPPSAPPASYPNPNNGAGWVWWRTCVDTFTYAP